MIVKRPVATDFDTRYIQRCTVRVAAIALYHAPGKLAELQVSRRLY
jgi:hypothetical protein